jgi:hypothetical protein
MFKQNYWHWCCQALQRTSTENSKQIFPEKELRGHSPNFHIHVFVSYLYIFPGSVHIFFCNRKGRSIVGICKSLMGT